MIKLCNAKAHFADKKEVVCYLAKNHDGSHLAKLSKNGILQWPKDGRVSV